MMVSRLSERERLFAEKHYDVFERFLRIHRPSTDEIYDVAVFSYLEAVQLYADQQDLEDNEFSKNVWKHMWSETSKHLRRENKKNKFKVLSLDYVIPKTQVIFGDTIIDETVNICEEVCEKLSHAANGYRLSHTYSFKPAGKEAVLEEVICVQG